MKVLSIDNIGAFSSGMDTVLLSAVMEGKNLFQLEEDLSIVLSNGHKIILLKGFIYDGASVPWLLEPFFPKFGIHSLPALVHDALYYSKYYSRGFCDRAYMDWQSAMGLPKRQRLFRYYAVRAFGWIAWCKGLLWPSDVYMHNRSRIFISEV